MILWFIAWFLFFSTLPSFSFLIVRISNYNLIFHWWKTYNSSFTFSITLTRFLKLHTHLYSFQQQKKPKPNTFKIQHPLVFKLSKTCHHHSDPYHSYSYYYFDWYKYEDDAWYHVVLLLNLIYNGRIQLPTI